MVGAGFCDPRKANATTLAGEGLDVKTAQARFGRAGFRTTLSIYARAVPKVDRAAADARSSRLPKARARTVPIAKMGPEL